MRKQMYTYKYKIIIFLSLLALLLALKFGRRDFQSKYEYDKISILSRFIAKEYCSCRFVVEQSPEYCQNYIGAEIPILGIAFNTKSISRISELDTNTPISPKKVTAKVLGFVKASAVFYQNENGCRISKKQ